MFLKTKTKEVSVFEAQALWLLLSTKYRAITRVQFWLLCCHDVDLKRILQDFLKDLQEHVRLLEREMEWFSIAEGPMRPSKPIDQELRSSDVTDESIGVEYLSFMQAMVEQVLFSIQYTTYNDHVQKFFAKFVSHLLEQTESLIRYLRAKGWLETPPYYNNMRQSSPGRINCFEAFHLWSHTDYRYNNIEETMRWLEFVHDPDFAAILKAGLAIMERQTIVLEKAMSDFGLVLPRRPPAFLGVPRNKEVFKDAYVFRTLFTGLQWAGVLHANAFKNSVTNDSVRAIFKGFLQDELKMVHTMVKYGKVKGWIPVPPVYNPL